MVRITILRSWSVFAISRCSMPAPRSNPSSTTYAVIIMATSQNQVKSMFILLDGGDGYSAVDIGAGGHWAVGDLTIDQNQEKDCQHGVEPHKAEQREQAVSGMHVF